MAITFHNLESRFKLRDKRKHGSWIRQTVEFHHKKAGEIAFVFTTNEQLRSMNRTYLNHNHNTDVITFDYSKEGVVSGDVFISVDQVEVNAVEYGTEFMDEIRRVMVHGVLHLAGLTDHTDSERRIMREKENEALHLWLKGN